jgi:signal peptidase II
LMRFTLGIILGGAIGNFIDRIRLGYVIDFIDWHWYTSNWPTFNIADSAISVGVVLLVIEMIKVERQNAEQAKDS